LTAIATLPDFALPVGLAGDGYRLRPETDADMPFLLALYGSTRANELAQLSHWPDAEKQAFVAQQFDAQRRHYRTHFPNCGFDVIERHGVPMGRLYLDRRVTQLHIIDIALLPAARGAGTGTAILTALIEMAQRADLGLGIFVEQFNPALSLYRRLGFAEIGDTGVYLEMEWRGAGGSIS